MINNAHILADQFPIPADRQAWLAVAATTIHNDFMHKYMLGQVEHKGDIGEVPVDTLLNELYQEHLDSLAYILEIRRRKLHDHVPITKATLTILCDVIDRLAVNGQGITDVEVLAKKQARNLLFGKAGV